MPDTKTLKLVLELVTHLPALHDQRLIVNEVDNPSRARRELEQAPPWLIERLAERDRGFAEHACRSAYCFAGWALVLKGYTQWKGLFWPPGDPGRSRWPGDPLVEAGVALGIDPGVLGDDLPTLFGEDTTLAEIRAWVAFYCGEIGEEELRFLLGLNQREPA